MGILNGEISYYEALENLPKMDHQRRFVTAAEPHAALVGGQGLGKTVALCTAAIKNAMEEPNGFSLIGRLHMPELESTTMKTFLEMVPEQYFDWHDTKKTGRFWNGHEVIFKHLDTSDPKSRGHIKSMNLSGAYVDEATETSEEMYFLLLGRLRRKTAKNRVFRAASNPNGHDWIWRHFFDPERKPELQLSNLGIAASTMENVFLDQSYIQGMLDTYPEDWRERFIYGSFSDFSDAIYKEFSERTHVWDAKQKYAFFGNSNKPPKEWPVIIGIDIGSDIDPWAIPIIAVAPNGMLFQDGEVYGNNMLVRDIAEELLEKIGGRKIYGAAYDYSNRQCALELSECGIFGTEAEKEIRPGLFKMAQYFHIDPRLEHPFFPGMKGSPRYFVSSECVNTRREIPGYHWKKGTSGILTEEPAHAHSHSPDGIRYAVHTFRPFPQKEVIPKKYDNPALSPISKEFWKTEEKFRDKMEKFSPAIKEQLTMQQWNSKAGQGNGRFQRPGRLNFKRTF
jgi:hypothetical protein